MFSKETQNLADSRDFYYELICPVDKHCRDHAIKHKFKMVCSPGCIKYSAQYIQNARTQNKFQYLILHTIWNDPKCLQPFQDILICETYSKRCHE